MNILRAEGLTKHFGGLHAVEQLSFEIAEGEIIGLIGPNGSGKTTTMNLLSGFVAPTSGDVYLHAERITASAPHVIAKRGLVRTFQLTSLFQELTVLENVIHGSHLRANGSVLGSLFRLPSYRRAESVTAARANRLLDFVGITRDRRSIPAKILSAGEQRYLEIAIALAAEPRVVLLDEPATGLNPEEAGVLMTLIGKMREEGRTILLVEHNMRFVMETCDRILVLNLGRRIAAGTPAEVSADEEVVSAYLGTRAVNA